ncbi:MAG: hypothetical protein KC449_25145 [Anaerolineales bacterium]|nr:hypothetical protein [Anaerolineales bacterium]
MTVQEAVQQLQHASVADRIQAIELLLQSLKDEMVYSKPVLAGTKPFRVRTFNLGVDVQVDRDEMYTDRVL